MVQTKMEDAEKVDNEVTVNAAACTGVEGADIQVDKAMNVDEAPEVMQAKMEKARNIDNGVTAEVVASTPDLERADIRVDIDKAMKFGEAPEVTKTVA